MVKLAQLLEGFSEDRRSMSVSAACARAVRTATLWTMRNQTTRLEDNLALRRHVAAVAEHDPFFYVSHRHYLLRGLSRRQRLAMARYHYQHEVYRFVPSYLDEAYSDRGLTLWQTRARDADFRLRLVPGADVLYEGGMSVELSVDEQRVAVISYSYVERGLVFDGLHHEQAPSHTTMLLTRKQLSADHRYQRVFHAAFDRCTAAHVCFAAVAGIAVAHGFGTVAGIRHEVQPSYTAQRHDRFNNAYSRFWRSLAGEPRGRFAFEVPVPMVLPPLPELRSKARRRAIRRRAHLEKILHSTCDVIRPRIQWSGTPLEAARTVSGVLPMG